MPKKMTTRRKAMYTLEKAGKMGRSRGSLKVFEVGQGVIHKLRPGKAADVTLGTLIHTVHVSNFGVRHK